MADSYTINYTYPDLEFLGGTQTQPVVAVGMTTKPSGIQAEFRVPQAGYSASLVAAAALGYADIYETLALQPWVVGVTWSQAPQPSGELADQVTITVASTSGNSTAQLTVLVNDLGPNDQDTKINALHAELDNTEAL
jgi:hypothetical protein